MNIQISNPLEIGAGQMSPMKSVRFFNSPLSDAVSGFLTRYRTREAKKVSPAGRLLDKLDPRAGVEAVLSEALISIAAAFDADAALVALRMHDERLRVFCWEAGETAFELAGNGARAATERLFSVPAHISAIYTAPAASRWPRRRHVLARDPQGRPLAPSPTELQALAGLAELIGQANTLTVPVLHAGSLTARIVLARREGPFELEGMDALAHQLTHAVPVARYAGLLDQLAAEGLETECARLGRDLHDSAIQPYIGLKLAMEALAQRCAPDNPLQPHVRQLVDMIHEELAAMRDMIAGLRGHAGASDPLLAGAVRRQAERFGQLFGIAVDVAIDGEMPVSRRLSGEIIHMLSEGLSNIRRHTRSRQAWVSLAHHGDALTLRICNRADPRDGAPVHFMPLSICERASALGGSVEVETDAETTAVSIYIPLPEAASR